MPKLIDHDARRTEIAEALYRIVLRDGISAVSIRDVAAEAGISTGSLRHLFATKDEMLTFSMRMIYDRAHLRMQRHVGITDPLRRAEALVHELLPLDDTRRVEMCVNLALITDAPGNHGLTDEALRAHNGVREVCRLAVVGIMSDGDAVDSEAMRLHALIDGLAMHLLVRRTDAPSAVRALVRAHLVGLAGDRAPRP